MCAQLKVVTVASVYRTASVCTWLVMFTAVFWPLPGSLPGWALLSVFSAGLFWAVFRIPGSATFWGPHKEVALMQAIVGAHLAALVFLQDGFGYAASRGTFFVVEVANAGEAGAEAFRISAPCFLIRLTLAIVAAAIIADRVGCAAVRAERSAARAAEEAEKA